MAGSEHHEVVIIGAGVAGIYQIKRLADLGVDATVLDSGGDLGGTWYWNRYPGARFDSESYTYGYSFSKELLDEWHWKEAFSSQPENLKYLNYVADKFDLRRYMQFDCRVEAAHFHEDENRWHVFTSDGRELTARFIIMALGLLSAPTMPRIEGVEDFEGASFHTFFWPHEPVALEGKRVGIIGTGATAIQAIPVVAEQAAELTVFQRRPNWAAPLNNYAISDETMADIRARYDEIFATCARTPGGFEHEPDRRGFWEVSRAEREAMWTHLYAEPGFGIWLRNFTEIFTDEKANAEFSAWFADRIRERVHDPELAEKLIPRDHGVGVQRLPLETNYFEAYNRDDVHLVDIDETPIERITRTGIRTSARDHDLDVIVYATGFDAITGAFDRIDIRGTGGRTPAREVARRPVDLFRRAGARFPEPDHADGPAELLGLDELSARHRDRGQLGHRAPRVHVGQRLRARGGDSEGRGGVDGARHADVRHHAPAQGPVLVHRLQLERRRARGGQRPLPRLHRRHAEVRQEDLRDDPQRLHRHHLRVRVQRRRRPWRAARRLAAMLHRFSAQGRQRVRGGRVSAGRSDGSPRSHVRKRVTQPLLHGPVAGNGHARGRLRGRRTVRRGESSPRRGERS